MFKSQKETIRGNKTFVSITKTAVGYYVARISKATNMAGKKIDFQIDTENSKIRIIESDFGHMVNDKSLCFYVSKEIGDMLNGKRITLEKVEDSWIGSY